ncbi:MAG TPA: hypothetical protein VGV93_05600 [Acidimicrobiales bacterium]|nr:hypothetical protein [Acidimicrobiales bacterium]
MKTVVAVLVPFTALVVFVMKVALEKEYQWWAPRVGAVLIRFAARMVPKSTRDSRRQEWLAELDYLEQSGSHGLLFAMRTLIRSPIAGAADRRIKEAVTRTVAISGEDVIVWEVAGSATVVIRDKHGHVREIHAYTDR